METGFNPAVTSNIGLSIKTNGSSGQISPLATSTSDGNSTKTRQDDTRRLEDDRIVQELAIRDREVRAHEAAHIAAGGRYVASAPSYTYQQGPDGRRYAVGGEVRLDTSQESDPQANLEKAETIRRAALAPVDPSTQDRLVASQATQMAAQARLAIAVAQQDARRAEQQHVKESAKAVLAFSEGNQSVGPQLVNVFA